MPHSAADNGRADVLTAPLGTTAHAMQGLALDAALQFVRGPEWSRAVEEFLDSRCAAFRSGSLEAPSGGGMPHGLHETYLEFCDLREALLGGALKELGLSGEAAIAATGLKDVAGRLCDAAHTYDTPFAPEDTAFQAFVRHMRSRAAAILPSDTESDQLQAAAGASDPVVALCLAEEVLATASPGHGGVRLRWARAVVAEAEASNAVLRWLQSGQESGGSLPDLEAGAASASAALGQARAALWQEAACVAAGPADRELSPGLACQRHKVRSGAHLEAAAPGRSARTEPWRPVPVGSDRARGGDDGAAGGLGRFGGFEWWSPEWWPPPGLPGEATPALVLSVERTWTADALVRTEAAAATSRDLAMALRAPAGPLAAICGPGEALPSPEAVQAASSGLVQAIGDAMEALRQDRRSVALVSPSGTANHDGHPELDASDAALLRVAEAGSAGPVLGLLGSVALEPVGAAEASLADHVIDWTLALRDAAFLRRRVGVLWEAEAMMGGRGLASGDMRRAGGLLRDAGAESGAAEAVEPCVVGKSAGGFRPRAVIDSEGGPAQHGAAHSMPRLPRLGLGAAGCDGSRPLEAEPTARSPCDKDAPVGRGGAGPQGGSGVRGAAAGPRDSFLAALRAPVPLTAAVARAGGHATRAGTLAAEAIAGVIVRQDAYAPRELFGAGSHSSHPLAARNAQGTAAHQARSSSGAFPPGSRNPAGDGGSPAARAGMQTAPAAVNCAGCGSPPDGESTVAGSPSLQECVGSLPTHQEPPSGPANSAQAALARHAVSGGDRAAPAFGAATLRRDAAADCGLPAAPGRRPSLGSRMARVAGAVPAASSGSRQASAPAAAAPPLPGRALPAIAGRAMRQHHAAADEGPESPASQRTVVASFGLAAPTLEPARIRASTTTGAGAPPSSAALPALPPLGRRRAAAPASVAQAADPLLAVLSAQHRPAQHPAALPRTPGRLSGHAVVGPSQDPRHVPAPIRRPGRPTPGPDRGEAEAVSVAEPGPQVPPEVTHASVRRVTPDRWSRDLRQASGASPLAVKDVPGGCPVPARPSPVTTPRHAPPAPVTSPLPTPGPVSQPGGRAWALALSDPEGAAPRERGPVAPPQTARAASRLPRGGTDPSGTERRVSLAIHAGRRRRASRVALAATSQLGAIRGAMRDLSRPLSAGQARPRASGWA